jgi:hypothetical protein
MPESWWGYVQRISGNAPHKDIAAAAGIDPSRVTGWKQGDRPKAENAAAFARAYGREPVEALVAAGYLGADEVSGAIEIHAPISDLGTAELLDELRRRFDNWQQAEGWPTGWGNGSQELPRSSGRDERPRMRRGKDSD